MSQLGQALENLPRYIFGYTVGLLAATLSDSLLTSLVLGCVGLGFIISPLVGATAFFLTYATLASVTNLANAVSRALGQVAQATAQQQRTLIVNPDPPSDSDSPTT